MGLLDDFYYTYLLEPGDADEQLEHMTGIVGGQAGAVGSARPGGPGRAGRRW
jgi:hypothetical protein